MDGTLPTCSPNTIVISNVVDLIEPTTCVIARALLHPATSRSHATIRVQQVILLVWLTALAMTFGCGETHTRYYLAAANLDDATNKPKVTFYRVTFDASSFGAKTNLQQGFYDADALHEFFGEVKQPDAATSSSAMKVPVTGMASNASKSPTATAGTFELRFNPDTQQWTIVNKERFTILYGANADAMAQQIKAFADNTQLGQDIGDIIKASLTQQKMAGVTPPVSKPSQLDELKKQVAAALKAAQTLADQLDKVADGMSADHTIDQGRVSLRDAAQDAIAALGSKMQLDRKNVDLASDEAKRALSDLSAAQKQ